MAAVVKSHIYEGKMVHAIYSDVCDEALTAGLTADAIIALIEPESGESVPALKELRALSTSCKKFGDKYLVRAVLRYVPESEESESK